MEDCHIVSTFELTKEKGASPSKVWLPFLKDSENLYKHEFMQSFSKGVMPASVIPQVPQEAVTLPNVTYKAITITIIENGVIALHRPFACIADAKAYIDRNMYQ